MSQGACLFFTRVPTDAEFDQARPRSAKHVSHAAAGADLLVYVDGTIGGQNWYIRVSAPAAPEPWLEEFRTNPDLPTAFTDLVPKLTPIVLDFNHYPAAREFVVALLSSLDAAGVWLDTDFGTVIRGDRLIAEVARDPEFDWRR